MTRCAPQGFARVCINLMLFLGLLACSSGPNGAASAQDDWNPFEEQDELARIRKARKAARARRRQALPPPLPPMNVPFDRARPGRGALSTGRAPYRPPPGFAPRPPLAPLDEKSRAVESTDLAPLNDAPGRPAGPSGVRPGRFEQGFGLSAGRQASLPAGRFGRKEHGFPGDIWRGLDLKTTETLITGLKIPPRSPALHALWRRLWLSDAPPPTQQQTGDVGRNYFPALRLEALYRSGLLDDMQKLLISIGTDGDSMLSVLKARALLGLGRREAGCRAAKTAANPAAVMPRRLKAEALLAMGYCAAARGDAGAAGLAAELAREQGARSTLALAVLDAVAGGQKPRLEAPERMSLMDFRFLQLASSADPTAILDSAEPALLSALALERSNKPALRLAAGERAAKLNAIPAQTLAQIYLAQPFAPSDFADPLTTRSKPSRRRALLYQAVEKVQRDPGRQARLMAALLNEARRDPIYLPITQVLVRPLTALDPGPGLGWFAEAATEIAAAAGAYDLARRWARSRSGDGSADPDALAHWLALIDIAQSGADNARGTDLFAVEQMARRGRFGDDDLHRLATVLDALEYNVPIPLWEAASRTPQPRSGHLPETGVLPRLKAAAAKNEAGHAILLALRTLGPGGAGSAHMIALGDAIRALKRAGLEAYARRLGFEALITSWPRGVTN